MPAEIKSLILAKIAVGDDELKHWANLGTSLNLVLHGALIAQFDGFCDLKELDWQAFRDKYSDIRRLDRILKAEGQRPDDFQVAKQADLLMAFYILGVDGVRKILDNLGYHPGEDLLAVNYDYYVKRTLHGSTLSYIVHASLANLVGNNSESWSFYSKALASDYQDIQGGTTGEGIHAGVMAGTVLVAIFKYGGVDLTRDKIVINPSLPEGWQSISFKGTFKGDKFNIKVTRKVVEIIITSRKKKIIIICNEQECELIPNAKQRISLV